MKAPQSLRVIARRWYLVLVGVLLTGALCAAANMLVPPSYEAQGSMVLMPPSAAVGDAGNPYLQLGGMGEAMDVLVRQTNATDIRERVLEDHPSATYVVEPDRTTSGSIIVVQAEADTAAESLELLNAAMATLPATLARMQDELGVTAEQRIDIMPVVIATEADLNFKQSLQVMALAGLAGLVGTLMFTALLDGLLISRRQRKAGAAPAGSAVAGTSRTGLPASGNQPVHGTGSGAPDAAGGAPGTNRDAALGKDARVR
ncbi:hypothetical protein [Arthrobacter sp.]|uniref:hypothetical protein n=1 Tax=Arthrobacter sp. TaxID=1667 RepID=UPI00289F9A64|nr:hypothetical protein [Arthrobacter sp.]